MLLKQLKIHNIRSYVDEEIFFPEGSTLLSGDMGSGKSSILLSIEFALFGASRPDLPAEALLRKGSTQGSAELTFLLNDPSNNLLKAREITIKRSIKKEKDAVKQLSGHIIVNNIKKELTPQELKAEIVSLLGYPEELVSKNKNYIYRYTVYTPQEEMKLILQEDEKLRLDILRKIFGIDKYEIIRENLQDFLREMRADIAVLKAKTEPLDEQKSKLEQLKTEKDEINKSVESLLPVFISLQQKLGLQKKEIVQLELRQKEFMQLKQDYSRIQALAEEKKKQVQQYLLKLEQLNLEIFALSLPAGLSAGLPAAASEMPSEILLGRTPEEVKEKLQKAENKKNSILLGKATLSQGLQRLRKMMTQLQEEINILAGQTYSIEEKKKSKENLQKEIAEKGELLQTKIKLENSLEEISVFVARNSILLSQSKSLLDRVISLKNCPTCLQEVSGEHKERIYNDESQKIAEIEPVLQELKERKEGTAVQKEICLKAIDNLNLKESMLARISSELMQLEEKQKQREEKRRQLESWRGERDQQAKQLAGLEAEDLGKLDFEISKAKDQLNLLIRKEILERNRLDLSMLIEENKKQAEILGQEIAVIGRKILESRDFAREIELNRENYEKSVFEEKELAIRIARFQTEFEQLKKQEELLHKVVDALNLEKNRLVKLMDIRQWLEEYFTKLTLTIERHVMTNIYYHFNQIFQEWFSILIDDESVCSRIDESFTPLIEQNGYEISFFNLSGGEKTSAALAYRLALNKVINDVVSGMGTKEIIILDEPTDGFSTEQLDKIREVLDKLSLRQVIIVSHESKIESFVDNVIRVSKEGHVSKIIC